MNEELSSRDSCSESSDAALAIEASPKRHSVEKSEEDSCSESSDEEAPPAKKPKTLEPESGYKSARPNPNSRSLFPSTNLRSSRPSCGTTTTNEFSLDDANREYNLSDDLDDAKTFITKVMSSVAGITPIVYTEKFSQELNIRPLESERSLLIRDEMIAAMTVKGNFFKAFRHSSSVQLGTPLSERTYPLFPWGFDFKQGTVMLIECYH